MLVIFDPVSILLLQQAIPRVISEYEYHAILRLADHYCSMKHSTDFLYSSDCRIHEWCLTMFFAGLRMPKNASSRLVTTWHKSWRADRWQSSPVRSEGSYWPCCKFSTCPAIYIWVSFKTTASTSVLVTSRCETSVRFWSRSTSEGDKARIETF